MVVAVPAAISMTFLGCGANAIFLELLISGYAGSGNIITFAQFLCMSIEGFIFTADFGRKKPKIPLSKHVFLVMLFFCVQVINNYSFNFNISMPLQMIFRSGSLIANLVLGMIILKRRYKWTKYISVIMISIGIMACTIASAGDVQAHAQNEDDTMVEYLRWLVGIAMITTGLYLSARMGIYQETMYAEYGKHPNEALYYNHMLPLPGFLFLAKDIYNHVILFNSSEPWVIPVLQLAIPKMWIFMLFNIISQNLCIRSVFILTTECTSLTVTLVVTLRKFMSIIISVVYFKNPFTIYHWFGSLLVFIGTLMFTEVFPKLKELYDGKPTEAVPVTKPSPLTDKNGFVLGDKTKAD